MAGRAYMSVEVLSPGKVGPQSSCSSLASEAALVHGAGLPCLGCPGEQAQGSPNYSCAQKLAAGHGFPWLEFSAITLTLLAVEGLELQSFSHHPALFLVAGPVFSLCLPCFSQSELHDGWVI
eukprot:1148378-Pelagomonas_calceolata.AAC.3